MGVICPCPWAIYMYKIMKSLIISETSWTIFTRFYMGPSKGWQVGQIVLHHWTRWLPCPYLVKHFSRTKKAFRLNLGIQHQGLNALLSLFRWYKDVLWLFMVWSNLCPSCCGSNGRSCMAVADMHRWSNRGPWASCLIISPDSIW